MRPAEVPLALNFGQARASVGSGGSLVNMYAQAAPIGAKADTVLVGVPGRRHVAQLQYLNDETELTNDTNVNAMHFALGKVVAVTDHAIYLIAEDGTWERVHNTGMAAPVGMAFNRFDVAAVNGTAGYWINLGEVVTIESADADYEPADSVTFLDGYMIFNRSGTGQVFSTAPYSRDIDGLDFADAEKAPDDAVGVLAVGDNLFIFGAASTEIWYNAAADQFPFLRVPNTTMEHGCAAIATARQWDGTVFWLTPAGNVIMASGLVPTRISDDQVEAALKARKADWSTARAYIYAEEGHTFYRLTVGDLTLSYDMATGYWHEVRNYSRTSDLARCYVQAWGRHFVGDDTGRILEMSGDFFDDADEPLVAEIVSMPYHNSRQYSSIGCLELQMDTGLSALGSEYVVTMAASRDGGVTWGTEKPESIGAAGRYGKPVRWRKLGARLDHRFRFRISDPFRRAVLAVAYMRM